MSRTYVRGTTRPRVARQSPPMADRRTKRNRTRAASRRRAIAEQS